MRIAYQRVGEGPLVVLVHGAAEDGRIWQPQLDGLAGEFTVVAWDEPGAGRSDDLPAGYTLADFADSLAVLIQTLDLGPAHVTRALSASSWRGRNPHHDRHLRRVERVSARRRSSCPDRRRPSDARSIRSRLRPALPGLFAGDPPVEFVSLLDAIAAGVRPTTLGRELAIMAATDLSDLLPHIAAPSLLIWGASDARSPLRVAVQFQEAIPDTKLHIIDGAAHMSNLERPQLVNEAVHTFCRAHPPAPA